MGENTKISWAHHTFNPWIGCTQISPACDNCYARDFVAGRLASPELWAGQRRRTAASTWKQPRAWNRKAEREGTRFRVFCASLADVFDNQVPEDWRADLFELIRTTPHLDWLLLTKRPQNIIPMVTGHGAVAGNGTRFLPNNVWLGTTAENQKEADRRVPYLLSTRARLGTTKLFLSCEPLLGPLDISLWLVPQSRPELDDIGSESCEHDFGFWRQSFQRKFVSRSCWVCGEIQYAEPGIDWVIVGGESGRNARPMHPDWARSLRDQCVTGRVPFHFKQWGAWSPPPSWVTAPTVMVCTTSGGIASNVAWPDGTIGDGAAAERGGPGYSLWDSKRAEAGRMLDGRTWDEVPSRALVEAAE